MSLETADLIHTAAVCTADGYDDNGEPKVSAAKEINCRWIERQSEAMDANGNAIRIDVSVIVAQEVPVGSVMWEGSLDDYPTPPSGGMYEVINTSRVSDLKGNHIRRTLGLARYSDELPATT